MCDVSHSLKGYSSIQIYEESKFEIKTHTYTMRAHAHTHTHTHTHTHNSNRIARVTLHVTYMKESRYIYERVMSHAGRSHVTCMKESCHTYEGVMSHI